jgi:hypothetical protein
MQVKQGDREGWHQKNEIKTDKLAPHAIEISKYVKQ